MFIAVRILLVISWVYPVSIFSGRLLLMVDGQEPSHIDC